MTKYFDVALFHETKAKKKKERHKNRNQNKAKTKDKKKGRKKRTRERQRKRKWKRGRQKRLRRNKGRDSKFNRNALLEGKQFFLLKANKGKEKQITRNKRQTKIRKNDLGPSEVALWATSPDPWTLPQKKKQEKQNKRTNKEGLGAKWGGPLGHLTWPSKKTKPKQKNKAKKKQKTRKTKKYPKNEFFSCQPIFPFGGGPKFPVIDNLAKKCAPKKHYKTRGFSKAFFENSYASRNGNFWTKKPKPKIPVIIFWAFSSLSTTKTHKCAETPIFVVFWQT